MQNKNLPHVVHTHWTVSLWVFSHNNKKQHICKRFEDNMQEEEHIVQSALREQKAIRCVNAKIIWHFVKYLWTKKRIEKYYYIIIDPR